LRHTQPYPGPCELVSRLTYRFALAGLAGVLLLLAVFAIGSALRTDGASHSAGTATQLSDAYQRARFALAEEESLERKYRIEPSVDVRARFDSVAGDFAAAIRDAAAAGMPADRALAAWLLDVQQRYLQGVGRMFDADDANDLERVLTIDSEQTEPQFATIEQRVNQAARAHRRDATEALAALRGTEHSVLTLTPVVFAFGLLLLGFFAVLLARINRQLARQARESAHVAVHDALTALPNRVLFADRLEHAIVAGRRHPAPFSVMVIDLDGFKEINDTVGHSIGDALLREIGPRLAPLLRPAGTIARLGGDEFALLLPTTAAEPATQIADRVLAALREPFVLDELTVSIDASVGIVSYPLHGEDAETLIQRADIAMYVAKGRGGGSAGYDSADDPYDPDRLLLICDLRRAIAEDELELHYQPKFTTQDLELAGVEALVRWRHPTRGLVAPGEFIPLAERTGAIRALTLLVLRKAARQWRTWHEDGLDIAIAVNLSVANLLDSELVDDIADILAEERVPAEGFELEITESTIMTDPERATAMLQRLAAMGLRLSIDDYGTGHSSLAYLRRLPVHELKIDRSFITHLADDGDDLQVVRSTIDLAHHLGLRVVAEGIEDAGSLALLQAHGCDLAQGFHLGRPVPAGLLLDQLRARGTALPSTARESVSATISG
jgi:diguanylate cyclase (GGDEF)-like protein